MLASVILAALNITYGNSAVEALPHGSDRSGLKRTEPGAHGAPACMRWRAMSIGLCGQGLFAEEAVV